MHVRIVDSQPGTASFARDWDFKVTRMTLRELIRQRVTREVERFNREGPETFAGLVQPEENERILNGDGVKFHYLRELDAPQQVERALQAFADRRFVVIAGRQIESLDEEIDLNVGEVEFIRLAPLIGG